MSDWAPDHARDHLAAVGHGPALLARSAGIAAGLRCAFIHPGGAELRLTVRTRGVQSQAACRQTFPSHAWSDQERQRPPRSAPLVTVRVGDRDVAAEVVGCESSADEDTFSTEAEHWVGALPGDGRLVVTVGWPQAGLAEETTTLHLSGLDTSDSVVQLLP